MVPIRFVQIVVQRSTRAGCEYSPFGNICLLILQIILILISKHIYEPKLPVTQIKVCMEQNSPTNLEFKIKYNHRILFLSLFGTFSIFFRIVGLPHHSSHDSILKDHFKFELPTLYVIFFKFGSTKAIRDKTLLFSKTYSIIQARNNLNKIRTRKNRKSKHLRDGYLILHAYWWTSNHTAWKLNVSVEWLCWNLVFYLKLFEKT